MQGISDKMLPEHLKCTFAFILQVSETLLEEWNTIIPKHIPSFCVSMMVVI